MSTMEAFRSLGGRWWRVVYSADREPDAKRPMGRCTIERLEAGAGAGPMPDAALAGRPGFALGKALVGDKVVRLHAGVLGDHGLLDWKRPVVSYEVANPAEEGEYPGGPGATGGEGVGR